MEGEVPVNLGTPLDTNRGSILYRAGFKARDGPLMGSEGREPIGYDGEVFYLGLALDPAYIEGFIEGCLERIGKDNPNEERLFRDLWEDETQRDVVFDCLKGLAVR